MGTAGDFELGDKMYAELNWFQYRKNLNKYFLLGNTNLAVIEFYVVLVRWIITTKSRVMTFIGSKY